MFENLGHLIGLKCHKYALYLCYIYIYTYDEKNIVLVLVPRVDYDEIITESRQGDVFIVNFY